MSCTRLHESSHRRARWLRSWLSGLPLLALFCGAAFAERYPLVATLSPAASGGEFFGGSLATEGTILVVGAPTASDTGINTGAVYIFEHRRDGWAQTVRLTASDTFDRDRFGSSVAISGDVLAIAARRQIVDRRKRGAVYIFERRGGEWIQVQKLVSELSPGLERPWAQQVLLEKDRLIVQGSEGTDVFQKENDAWRLESVIEASNAFALHGRILTTGSHTADVRDFSLTQFRRRASGWVERDTLNGFEGQCYWGHAVSRADKRMVVSDPTDTSCPELLPGKVHIYQRKSGQWREKATVEPTTPSSYGVDVGFFGFATALGDRTLLVQALDMTFPFWTGTVYVFERRGGNWVEQAKLEARQGQDEFGQELLVGDDFFFVSSPGDPPGKVLVYQLPE